MFVNAVTGARVHEVRWWSWYYDTLGPDAFSYIREVFKMAGVGKNFEFHGSFLSKEAAVKKEKEVGGFIRERKVNGKIRYFVLTEKK